MISSTDKLIGEASVSSEPSPTVQRVNGHYRELGCFQQKLAMVKSWFKNSNDNEKNVLLREILKECQPSQIHLLSTLLEKRLHEYCPPNCNDPLAAFPSNISLRILGFLDPVSLCRATAVCRKWNQLATEPTLWRAFCTHGSRCRLSALKIEQEQLVDHTYNGLVNWKGAFAERYRLRRNWTRGRCVKRTFEGHAQGISCVQFDNSRIVSGSSDTTIKVWDIRTNNHLAVMTLRGHSDTVRCLQLYGNRLASGSNDCTLKVWDVASGSTWSGIVCRATMVGHTDAVRCLQLDAAKVVSGSYDHTLKIWDLNTGQCANTLSGHENHVLCLQFDEHKLVSGSADNTIKIWDVISGQCVLTIQNAHQNAVTCLQFDDTRIVSGSHDSTIKFWDVRTGRWLNTLDPIDGEGHTGVIRCLQADSWRMVSAGDDKTIKVWDLKTCKNFVTLTDHTDGVTCLRFNDKCIVSGSYDKTVKLWDFSMGG